MMSHLHFPKVNEHPWTKSNIGLFFTDLFSEMSCVHQHTANSGLFVSLFFTIIYACADIGFILNDNY